MSVTLCFSEAAPAQLARPQLPPVVLHGVSESELKDANEVVQQNLLLSGQTTGSAPLADDLAFFLRRHYESVGYVAVGVEWELKGGTMVLNVREGGRLKIGRISFPGALAEQDKELQEYLMRPTRERYDGLTEPKPLPYVESDVGNGADYALRYLLSQGYEEAVVGDPVVKPDGAGMVNISVPVTLGPRWKFGQVSVTGMPGGFQKFSEDTLRGMGHEYFSATRMERARSELEANLQQAGYFSAVVESQYERKEGKKVYKVKYVVTPGVPRRITKVVPRGQLTAGAARVIRGSFRPEIGRVYKGEQLDISFRRVLNTGMFEELRTELQPEGVEGLTVFVEGEETNRFIFGIYGGYDSFLGSIVGGTAQATHLPKPGDLLRAEVEVNGRGVNGTLSWIDPAVFETPYSFQLDLTSRYFVFKSYDLYSTGLTATLSRKYTREFSGSIFAGVSVNASSSHPLTPPQLGPANYQVARAGINVRYDERDSPLLPKKGLVVTFGLEASEGFGDASFSALRSDLTAAWFFKMNEKWRGYVGLRHSNLYGAAVENIPINLRLFAGGMNSVRGFDELMMGEHGKGGLPIGGTQAAVFTTEIMREVYPNLDLAAFWDSGYISREQSALVAKDFDIKNSVGMGIRYQLPFGPLRLDYAVNVHPTGRDPFGALHLGFGFSW